MGGADTKSPPHTEWTEHCYWENRRCRTVVFSYKMSSSTVGNFDGNQLRRVKNTGHLFMSEKQRRCVLIVINNSTPHLSYVHQLILVFRFVNKEGKAVFEPIVSHMSDSLTECIVFMVDSLGWSC